MNTLLLQIRQLENQLRQMEIARFKLPSQIMQTRRSIEELKTTLSKTAVHTENDILTNV